MIWSYSAAKAFQSCQRQWYFRSIYGIGQAKKSAERRNIYILGKHDSLSAWRGRLVDEIISEHIVEASNVEDELPTSKQLIDIARSRFERQMRFAKENPVADHRLDVKQAGESFALLRNVQEIDEEEFDKAWLAIERAIKTFYQLDQAKDVIKNSELSLSQCVLQFKLFEGVTVKAVPDLLAFASSSVPTIVDWKVHEFGTHDAWVQLAVYAIALERCKAHWNWSTYRPADGFGRQNTRLIEVQLLTNVVREHELDEEHFAQAEEFINSTSYEMSCLVDGRKPSELSLSDFRVAQFPDTCDACSYKSFCWDVAHAN
jgi:PD-(D/E)XK nuclease superfamily